MDANEKQERTNAHRSIEFQQNDAAAGSALDNSNEVAKSSSGVSQQSQAPISHFMGLFWCIMQGFTRGGMYSGQKIAHEITGVKLSHIVLIRSLFIMLGAQIYAWKDGKDTSLSAVNKLPVNLKTSLFWRSFYGYGAIVAAMIAIKLSPVSIAVSIMMTQVFVSTLAGYFFNKEIISRMEIFCIVGGFIGVLILTNDTFFDQATKDRHTADQKKYPHYYFGVGMGVLYTLFSALNFFEMRRMGHGVHSSIKTYYFGLLCSLGTIVYIVIVETNELFEKKGDEWFVKREIPINFWQFLASMIVGFFSWANQESLSLSLTIVKQGTASAFNNLALIVSFLIDALYFHRKVFNHDFIGAGLIIFFAVVQSLLANAAAKEDEAKQNSRNQGSKPNNNEEEKINNNESQTGNYSQDGNESMPLISKD